MLCGEEPLQRVPLSVRGPAPRHYPHAVVRPPQQVYASEGQ